MEQKLNFIKIIFFIFLISPLVANEFKVVFKGDIDPILGDFTAKKLEGLCGIEEKAFYAFWKDEAKRDKEDVNACSGFVLDYAKSLGFYNAKVTLEFNENEASIELVKNEPIRIRSISIDKEYAQIIGIEESMPFSSKAFTNSKVALKSYLGKEGYAKVTLDAKAYVDLDEYVVDVVYKVSKNELCTFGKITVSNNAKVDEALILSLLAFRENEQYDLGKIEQSYEELYGLGIYRMVAIEPDVQEKSTSVPVNIFLELGEYRQIGYSLGYNTDKGFNAKASYQNENFMGNLKRLSLDARVGEDGYMLGSTLFLPYLPLYFDFTKELSFTNEFKLEQNEYRSYRERTLSEKAFLSKEFFDLKHNVGFLSELSHIVSDIKDYESGNYLFNSLFYKLEKDKRDNAKSPKNGYFTSFYLERSLKQSGSDEEYTKAFAELSYIKTYEPLSFALRTKMGIADSELPIFKHFFAGGSNSNRGYSYQKLGRKDSKDNPYGGLSVIDSSIEAEYRAFEDIGVVGFYDITWLGEKPKEFSGKPLDSIGVGLRYYTPIGPLRLDIGFPLKEGGFAFHLGIGQVF